MFSTEGAKKNAALSIETSERPAKIVLDFQAKASEWAKDTPFGGLIEARNSRVDMTFAVFLTMALLLLHDIWEGAAGGRRTILAGLCLGLAVLSKGPLALALLIVCAS